MKRNFLRDTQPANHPSSLPPPWVTRFGELFSRTRPQPPPTCTVRECVRLEIRSNRKTPGRKRSSIWPAEGEAWKSSFDSFDSDVPTSSPPPSSKSFSNFPPPSLREGAGGDNHHRSNRQSQFTPSFPSGRTAAERWQEVATKRGWFRFPPSGLIPWSGPVSKNLTQPGRFDFLFESGGAAKGETARMEDLEDLRFLKQGLENL